METTFNYNISEILQDVHGEPDLIPYWIKLDLLDHGVPIEINPRDVADSDYSVSRGNIKHFEKDGCMVLVWTVNKK